MTEVRTFRAGTMQEALAVVRREFGPEAVILHTKETGARSWPWSRRSAEVEVIAGRDMRANSSEARRSKFAASNAAVVSLPANEIKFDTPQIPAPTLPRAARQSAPPPVIQGLAGIRLSMGSPNQSGAAIAPSVPATEIQQQVQSLQALLQQLTSRLEPDRSAIPPELFGLYTRLIDGDVPEGTARSLMIRVQRDFPRTDLSDGAQARMLLAGMVEADLSCTGAIRTTPGRRKVVALVGPTGVGKTTTIAKLAANFKLRAGLRVGLVTVDTYRIAAVDQLRTYAEIIDIPMKVVTGPRDMPRVLSEMSDMDLVLVDTAGRSPSDDLQLQELKSLLAEGPVDEVHLVLSMAASTRSLLNTARQFSGVRTSSLILTKLDESPGLGQLLAALPELPFPVSYLTTGQNVPDDIEPAVAARLAKLVLGFETLRT